MDHLTIFIVDEDEIWRRGFRRLLEEEGGFEVCGEASDGSELSGLVLRAAPDVLVVDSSMPVELIQRMHRLCPGVGILVFGSHEGSGALEGFLTAGAQGFVSKSDSSETALSAVASVARNERFLSPSASEIALERYLGRSLQRSESRRPPQLTRREKDVVRLLAEGRTNREIARALDISVKTVENHRANAMRKLGVHSVSDLVREALRRGLLKP